MVLKTYHLAYCVSYRVWPGGSVVKFSLHCRKVLVFELYRPVLPLRKTSVQLVYSPCT